MTYYLIRDIIAIILRTYQVILSLSIIISWIPGIRESWIGRLIYRISSWYFGYFGNALSFGGLNFGPMIGLIIFSYIFWFI